MNNLIDTILRCLDTRQPVVMATIVSQSGSTPRTAGTQMLVMPDGEIAGTIGGGQIEAEVMRTASALFDSGGARIRSFELNQQGIADDLDVICGGRLTLLLETVAATEDNRIHFQSVKTALDKANAGLAVTAFTRGQDILRIQGRYLLPQDNSGPGRFPFPEPMLNLLKATARDRRSAALVPCEEILFLVQPIQPPECVYIFGAGHVSRQLAALTKQIGFHTVVLDDRQEFANRERFGEADAVIVLENFEHALADLAVDVHSYLVIVTRGHAHDKTVLAQALRSDAGYIGMIGSHKKRDIIYRKLLEEGFSPAALDRVHSPIGLDIAAETPAEIAVSIAAELIRHRAAAKRRSLEPA